MKILVVDDNPINRLLPLAWLRREACDPVESGAALPRARLHALPSGCTRFPALFMKRKPRKGFRFCRVGHNGAVGSCGAAAERAIIKKHNANTAASTAALAQGGKG